MSNIENLLRMKRGIELKEQKLKHKLAEINLQIERKSAGIDKLTRYLRHYEKTCTETLHQTGQTFHNYQLFLQKIAKTMEEEKSTRAQFITHREHLLNELLQYKQQITGIDDRVLLKKAELKKQQDKIREQSEHDQWLRRTQANES